MNQSRFRDKGETLYDFLLKKDILMECPYCFRCAKGVRISEERYQYKLICTQCGLITNPNIVSWGKGSFRGLKLWLRTNCCGNVLWAYNKEHLSFLDGYINSSLREQMPNKNQSLASRLPDWIKSSKNRLELSKGIAKLENKLKQCET
ncbi:hypothetical protein [Paenibacillus sp. SI8]|uniref:hypothetical protein n=1 Tax=unclassified Paenibacillus TaxID=185978 RepID=UPI003465ADA6